MIILHDYFLLLMKLITSIEMVAQCMLHTDTYISEPLISINNYVCVRVRQTESFEINVKLRHLSFLMDITFQHLGSFILTLSQQAFKKKFLFQLFTRIKQTHPSFVSFWQTTFLAVCLNWGLTHITFEKTKEDTEVSAFVFLNVMILTTYISKYTILVKYNLKYFKG